MPDPIRLLIVEDLDTDAELVLHELERGGLKYDARRAASRAEFFAAIDAAVPDLVLSDYNLPDINGLDVIREMAERSAVTPVIIVTGSINEETAVECIKAGATDYLLKEHLSRLVPAVQAAIELRRLRIEEQRARRDVVAARDYYITLVEKFPNPVWRCDSGGRCDYLNKAWLDLTGRSLEQELGDGWVEGIHPDDFARAIATWFAAFDTRSPYFTEYRLRRADGSYHWLASYGRPITGLDGEFAGYVGSCYDVQATHELQQKTESQWRFLESLLGHIDQIIYVFDDDDTIIYANQWATTARGIPIEELTGHSLHDFKTATPEYLAAYQRAKTSRERVRCEAMTLPTRDGARHVYDGWLTPFTGPEGANVLISSFTDITARVDAEATRTLLSAAIEHSAEAVVITDAAGRIEYVNPAFETSSGYSQAEALGRNPRILKSGAHDAAFYADLWATITQGVSWRGRMTNRRKDGSFYTEEASISPVPDATGAISHFVAVKRDLSRELELEQQLAHSQKLDAVGRLAGGIAHDFNNLLGVIGGYAELLTQSLGDVHPARERVAQILIATERATALTRQLLAFGRKQVLQPRVIDLNGLLREVGELLRQLLREPIELEIATSDEPATVFVDRSQMEQVIFNLAVNSRQAMPDGGKLRIELARLDVDADSSSLRDAVEPGRWTRMTVADTGSGIPADQLSRIFEPFFTTRADSGGSGLGLATVYGIVRQSGGNISVTSAPGKGTSFRIYLPSVEASGDESSQRPAPAATRQESRSANILVAEDVDLLREMIREGLESAGMTVLEARDGEEALAVSRRETRPIDLLLTDVVMPKMSGRELSERMQIERPELRVLFMSGYTGDIIAASGVVEEGVELLQKPFTIDTLVERIQKLIGAPE